MDVFNVDGQFSITFKVTFHTIFVRTNYSYLTWTGTIFAVKLKNVNINIRLLPSKKYVAYVAHTNIKKCIYYFGRGDISRYPSGFQATLLRLKEDISKSRDLEKSTVLLDLQVGCGEVT